VLQVCSVFRFDNNRDATIWLWRYRTIGSDFKDVFVRYAIVKHNPAKNFELVCVLRNIVRRHLRIRGTPNDARCNYASRNQKKPFHTFLPFFGARRAVLVLPPPIIFKAGRILYNYSNDELYFAI
jgi:hypothetical protein